MQKFFIFLLAFLAASGTAAGENVTDPFDLSSINEKADELGVPTVSEVNELEDKARELFKSEDCRQAIPVLNEFSKKSNFIANLIASGLEPYYGASYDDRKNYDYSNIQPLIKYEELSNGYKQKRNIAMVMLGECYAKIGERKKAATHLSKALSLIDLDNHKWWERARKALYDLLAVQ